MKPVLTISGVSDADAKDLAAFAVARSYPRHTIIIHEGDDTDGVYFVRSGAVRVFLSDDDGNQLVIATLRAGEYFGEMALEPGSRSASVMAIEPLTVAVVKMADFRTFLRSHPDFVLVLLGKLIRRTRAVTRNFKSMALLGVYGRLAQLLNDLAENADGKMIIVEPLTQQEIACRIGCSREMVGKILKDLADGGYIEVSRRRVEIKRSLPASW